MTHKIFKSILMVVTLGIVASFMTVIGVLYTHVQRAQTNQLKEQLQLASYATEQSGVNYLKELDSQVYRFTWIDANGVVLFDSKANVSEMENHLDRVEIQDALQHGVGHSIRKSETLTEQTVYEAKRLSDSTVLRVSITTATVISLVLDALWGMLVIYGVIVIVTTLVARYAAKRITEPINQLDFNKPLYNQTYEELSPLLERLDAQQFEISRRVKALQHKTEEFDRVVNYMKEGLIVLDKHKRILSSNKAARSIFKFSEQDVGQSFLMFERQSDVQEALDKVWQTNHSHVRVQRDGKVYHLDMSAIEVEHEKIGIVILLFDVTEQAQHEKMRREFSANVSHEFKTPLQSILGSAELIDSGMVAEKDLPFFVQKIRTEANRLVLLIEDVIRLSQLDEGVSLEAESISVHHLVEDIAKRLEGLAQQKNIRFYWHGQAHMHGIPKLVYDSIYNVCDNAIKYNRDGGEVTVAIVEQPRHVEIVVSDTGEGIPVDQQQRVFERFYRVDSSHSKKSGGTGLGLSIVKHAVMYHKGEVSVESELGKGTRIIMTFPK